uniref:ATP synthase F0 subunit 8 n=1 Tax=Sahlingia subintegra TaxID=468936 RepID=UPI001FCD5F2A|nr:ATP synthase F0 subunit 8 [Sahlingia subintegra]UNJ19071.1 ATP synthase F0 subunit 8 [Sahlingia subintegra]
MPQLDSTIIFTQLFWLILTFSFLYGCFLFFILPLVVKALKLRNTLTQLQNTAQNTITNKKDFFFTNSLRNLQDCLAFCELQNINQIKSFVQLDFVKQENSFFLQKLHTLLIYNLIK